jgi:hypothetical protein
MGEKGVRRGGSGLGGVRGSCGGLGVLVDIGRGREGREGRDAVLTNHARNRCLSSSSRKFTPAPIHTVKSSEIIVINLPTILSL